MRYCPLRKTEVKEVLEDSGSEAGKDTPHSKSLLYGCVVLRDNDSVE